MTLINSQTLKRYLLFLQGVLVKLRAPAAGTKPPGPHCAWVPLVPGEHRKGELSFPQGRSPPREAHGECHRCFAEIWETQDGTPQGTQAAEPFFPTVSLHIGALSILSDIGKELRYLCEHKLISAPFIF